MNYSKQSQQFLLERGSRVSCDKKVSKYLNLPIIPDVYQYFVSSGLTGKNLIQNSFYHSFRIHQLLPMVNFFNSITLSGWHNVSKKPLDVCIIGGDFNWRILSLQDQEFLLSCLGVQKWCRILHPEKYFDSRCIDFIIGLSKYPLTSHDYLTIPLDRTKLLGITEPYQGKGSLHCSDHPLVLTEIEVNQGGSC